MLTQLFPFIWKWEESALQFYDLIPLGEISVTPGMSNAQGMENRKKTPSLRLYIYLRMCVTVTRHLHTQIVVCTLKYLCVGAWNPWVVALCLKKTQRSLCTAVPVISLRSASLWLALPGFRPPGLNVLLCAVSQQIRGEGFRWRAVCVQSPTLAPWWVTWKEEETVRDTFTLQQWTTDGPAHCVLATSEQWLSNQWVPVTSSITIALFVKFEQRNAYICKKRAHILRSTTFSRH